MERSDDHVVRSVTREALESPVERGDVAVGGPNRERTRRRCNSGVPVVSDVTVGYRLECVGNVQENGRERRSAEIFRRIPRPLGNGFGYPRISPVAESRRVAMSPRDGAPGYGERRPGSRVGRRNESRVG
ncbi:hypothetical protein D8S78_01530 [Natrialba swarupiae]|nr:hypothetical protein [Natrialba swarupiae]